MICAHPIPRPCIRHDPPMKLNHSFPPALCGFGFCSTDSSVHQGYVRGASFDRISVKPTCRFSKNDFLNSRWSLFIPNQYVTLASRSWCDTHLLPNISYNNGLSTKCAPSAEPAFRQISCLFKCTAIVLTFDRISCASSSARGKTSFGSGRSSANTPCSTEECAGYRFPVANRYVALLYPTIRGRKNELADSIVRPILEKGKPNSEFRGAILSDS